MIADNSKSLAFKWRCWKTLVAPLMSILETVIAPFSDVLRHIAPARVRGIDFHGTMDFPLARYRDRLIPAATRR